MGARFMFWALILIFLAILVKCALVTTREGMAYLDQYEKQDNYRNVPGQWPIIETPVTAMFDLRRKYTTREKQAMEERGCGPQGENS